MIQHTIQHLDIMCKRRTRILNEVTSQISAPRPPHTIQEFRSVYYHSHAHHSQGGKHKCVHQHSQVHLTLPGCRRIYLPIKNIIKVYTTTHLTTTQRPVKWSVHYHSHENHSHDKRILVYTTIHITRMYVCTATHTTKNSKMYTITNKTTTHKQENRNVRHH